MLDGNLVMKGCGDFTSVLNSEERYQDGEEDEDDGRPEVDLGPLASRVGLRRSGQDEHEERE